MRPETDIYCGRVFEIFLTTLFSNGDDAPHGTAERHTAPAQHVTARYRALGTIRRRRGTGCHGPSAIVPGEPMLSNR
jgi:hypothetical protein